MWIASFIDLLWLGLTYFGFRNYINNPVDVKRAKFDALDTNLDGMITWEEYDMNTL